MAAPIARNNIRKFVVKTLYMYVSRVSSLIIYITGNRPVSADSFDVLW